MHVDAVNRALPRDGVMAPPARPTPAEIAAAAGRTIPDVVGPGLRVLFVGINPSLYSGAVGHHFARPGNRFWPVLHRAGFTPRPLSPHEDRQLPAFGLGVTNLVARATAAADALRPDELVRGARRLATLVRRWRPAAVAVLGVGAYRVGFGQPRAQLGRQPVHLAGTPVWVLPNPSGLNAHYQLPALVRVYAALRDDVDAGARPRPRATAGERARPGPGDRARRGERRRRHRSRP